MSKFYLKYNSKLPLEVCKSRLEEIDFNEIPFITTVVTMAENLLKIKYPLKVNKITFSKRDNKYYFSLDLGGGGLFKMTWNGYLAEDSQITTLYLAGSTALYTKFFVLVLPMSIGLILLLVGLSSDSSSNGLNDNYNALITGCLFLVIPPTNYCQVPNY